MSGSERICSNCQQPTLLSKAMTTTHHGRLVAVLCPQCQQAKKVQVTLEKKQNKWEFFQYFPVEA